MEINILTMKRLYTYICTLTAILVTGCGSDTTEIIYPEPDFANLELSSKSAVMESDGGVKEIFISTNRDEWSVECSADWVDFSIEKNSLTLYVDENLQGEERMAVLDIVAGKTPDTAVARFKLTQLGGAAIDLSESSAANCYIVPTSTSAKLRADIRGNGVEDGNSRYMATYGAEILDGSYADVIWEATFDGDKSRSVRIIDGTPIYSADNKHIYIRTGDVEGNALVGIFSGEGELLWSWHIWVTNDKIEHSTANGLEWMDRNIGALTTSMSDISNRGMLYQWGRKEPFLPSPAEYVEMPTHSYDEEFNLTESEEEFYAIQDQIESLRVGLNINNMQSGDGKYEWQYADYPAPIALNAPGNIDYAIEHPTTILACRTDIAIGEYIFDWYMQQDITNSSGVMLQSASNLWGDAEAGRQYKTIFDPCPPGYCVPPRGAFGEIPKDYACLIVDDEWSKEPYGWRWSGGNNDFFPSTGNFDVSGVIGETSERLLYWTAESFGGGTAGFGKSATLFVTFNKVFYGIYPLLDETLAESWFSYGARAYTASVRCVREQGK